MKLFALTCLLLVIIAGTVIAQDDPIGAIDTVSISHLSVIAGRDFRVNINLWNDEEIGAVTLPFSYPIDKLEFQSIDFSGGRLDYLSSKPTTVDTDNGTIIIGALVISEEFIQPGQGALCVINFKAKDDLVPGELLFIDTTYIPPAGRLLLTDNSGTANFTPAFIRGEITVSDHNRPPVFATVPDVYIAEGDSLYIDLQVSDPEDDAVIIVNPIHPYNSEFIDNGDGTARFAWRPDYIGPLSADLSPFTFIFWTSDNHASSYIRVKVNVININRAPIISAPDSIAAEAGDSLGIHVSAFDPDFESTEWEISGLPSGAEFDFDNPGLINWVSDFADSGHYQITLIATDPYGLADTATIDIELYPVTLYSLRIDTLTSFSGRAIEVDVFLKNRIAITDYNILIRVDPSVLLSIGVTNESTRSEDLAIFRYQIDDNGISGNIRIIGKAVEGNPIETGEGLLFRLELRICDDLNFVGQQIPIVFTSIFSFDNILILENGETVDDTEINLFNGYVLISSGGDQDLGDINLNNVAYEVSDAVYFSNYFISQNRYPLNEQQLLNSDMNRDGFAPSVADLVLLIKVITGEIEPPASKINTADVAVRAELSREETGIYLILDAPVELGGAFITVSGPGTEEISPSNYTEMDLMTNTKRGKFSCLFVSYTKKSIPAGDQPIIKLSGQRDLDISIEEIDVSDIYGRALMVEKPESNVLPTSFELFQNKPNPFNPVTEISFSLMEPSWVTLAVYNILGQTVITLADREYPAGQHSLTWDGADTGGNQVASGVYLYKIKAGEITSSKKMVLLK